MPLQCSIIRVLAYFDLFNYPLSQAEIHFFLDKPANLSELEDALKVLVKDGLLFRLEGFYSLQDNPTLAVRRIAGNRHAEELLLIADKISRRLFRFPYVRGIGISGSLSKNYADENADIDYFVITRANRLWIARTSMHLYKKWTFLKGHQHWYCMNYYVDEEALEIEEKNIFTAIELLTLMPVCGNGGLLHFFNANEWASAWLPQYRDRARIAPASAKPSFFKTAVEWLFNNRVGDQLDNLLMKWTTRRWQAKEASGVTNAKGLRMSLKTGKHFSRPNPGMLQKKILTSYAGKLNELSTKWGLDLMG